MVFRKKIVWLFILKVDLTFSQILHLHTNRNSQNTGKIFSCYHCHKPFAQNSVLNLYKKWKVNFLLMKTFTRSVLDPRDDCRAGPLQTESPSQEKEHPTTQGQHCSIYDKSNKYCPNEKCSSHESLMCRAQNHGDGVYGKMFTNIELWPKLHVR